METIEMHFNNWFGVIFFVALYSIILIFIPFYKKMTNKPKGAYLAFVLAFAIEMHGIPFSMNVIAWFIGKRLPEGVLWGHTLFDYIGYWGMYINILLAVVALAIIMNGWHHIHKNYWSKEEGQGKLVTTGIYKHIRHPQYTGLLLLSLGMLIEWATLPLLVMYPVMILLYAHLAKKEENDMLREFGNDYVEYKKRTKMFIPFIV